MILLGIVFLALLSFYLWWNRSALFVAAAHRAFRRGDEPGTLKAFAQAEAAGRLNAETTASYAYLLLKGGQTDAASTLLDGALRHGRRGKALQESDRRLLLTYRSLVLWKTGALDEAIALLEDLLSQGYRTLALYGNLGFYLIEKGDWERAEAVCLEAADWASGKVILDNLASLRIHQKNWDAAAEVYDRLLPLEPKFPEAWWGAGRVALEKGDPTEARRRWNVALEQPFHALTTVSRQEIEDALSSPAFSQLDREEPHEAR